MKLILFLIIVSGVSLFAIWRRDRRQPPLLKGIEEWTAHQSDPDKEDSHNLLAAIFVIILAVALLAAFAWCADILPGT